MHCTVKKRQLDLEGMYLGIFRGEVRLLPSLGIPCRLAPDIDSAWKNQADDLHPSIQALSIQQVKMSPCATL